MKTFIAVVYKDPDSAWGVSFPDLPGCFSAADSLDHVVPSACEAMDLWFEDSEDIEPRNINEIRVEVAEELAEGAILVAVPRVASNARKRQQN